MSAREEGQRRGSAPAVGGVLVVIPTLNEARHIGGILQRLSEDLPADLRTTFVVADGGSTDGTVGLVEAVAAERADVHLLHNPRRLQSAAVNLAVERFGDGMDVLVRCDAHGAYPAGFVRQLVATIQRERSDSVVIPMDSTGGACLQKAVAWVSNTPVGTGGSAHRGGRVSGYVDHGHHAAFRIDSFRRVGGYDETYSHNEDAEYDCRLRGVGGRIFLDAEIRQEYFPRDTLRGMWKQYFNYGVGRSRTVRRHPTSIRLRQLALPVHLVFATLSLIAGVAIHPVMAAWPVLYTAILAATGVMLALKHRSICGLLAAPAAFVMHTAWSLGFLWGFVKVREKRWAAPAVEGEESVAASCAA